MTTYSYEGLYSIQSCACGSVKCHVFSEIDLSRIATTTLSDCCIRMTAILEYIFLKKVVYTVYAIIIQLSCSEIPI